MNRYLDWLDGFWIIVIVLVASMFLLGCQNHTERYVYGVCGQDECCIDNWTNKELPMRVCNLYYGAETSTNEIVQDMICNIDPGPTKVCIEGVCKECDDG